MGGFNLGSFAKDVIKTGTAGLVHGAKVASCERLTDVYARAACQSAANAAIDATVNTTIDKGVDAVGGALKGGADGVKTVSQDAVGRAVPVDPSTFTP